MFTFHLVLVSCSCCIKSLLVLIWLSNLCVLLCFNGIYIADMTKGGVEDNIVLSNGDKMLAPNYNGNLKGKNSLESELESILVRQQQQHQHNRDLVGERERDLNISRSGSAPPTVEGSLSAVGSLFRNSNLAQSNNSSNNNNNGGGNSSNDILTEEQIRSHPAYLAYYYSNVNLNPRLPPPLLSREDWRIAQRVQAGGCAFMSKNLMEQGGGSSLFAMQPGFPIQRAEDELIKLRKTAARNLSRGTLESNNGIGARKKSFADIVQVISLVLCWYIYFTAASFLYPNDSI